MAGRKPIEITAAIINKVEMFASRGLLDKEIMLVMGWSHNFFYQKKRLLKEFNDAIERGRAKGHAAVANKLYDSCMSGNQSAIQFYLARRANWHEPKQQSNHDEDSPALSVHFSVAEPKGDIKVTRGSNEA